MVRTDEAMIQRKKPTHTNRKRDDKDFSVKLRGQRAEARKKAWDREKSVPWQE